MKIWVVEEWVAYEGLYGYTPFLSEEGAYLHVEDIKKARRTEFYERQRDPDLQCTVCRKGTLCDRHREYLKCPEYSIVEQEVRP